MLGKIAFLIRQPNFPEVSCAPLLLRPVYVQTFSTPYEWLLLGLWGLARHLLLLLFRGPLRHSIFTFSVKYPPKPLQRVTHSTPYLHLTTEQPCQSSGDPDSWAGGREWRGGFSISQELSCHRGNPGCRSFLVLSLQKSVPMGTRCFSFYPFVSKLQSCKTNLISLS